MATCLIIDLAEALIKPELEDLNTLNHVNTFAFTARAWACFESGGV
jgi:hypothetical protein